VAWSVKLRLDDPRGLLALGGFHHVAIDLDHVGDAAEHFDAGTVPDDHNHFMIVTIILVTMILMM
jgi:hypothetical protein